MRSWAYRMRLIPSTSPAVSFIPSFLAVGTAPGSSQRSVLVHGAAGNRRLSTARLSILTGPLKLPPRLACESRHSALEGPCPPRSPQFFVRRPPQYAAPRIPRSLRPRGSKNSRQGETISSSSILHALPPSPLLPSPEVLVVTDSISLHVEICGLVIAASALSAFREELGAARDDPAKDGKRNQVLEC